jgi:hypothetical protein
MSKHPLFGTLFTDRANAMAIHVPASQEYLVVFEAQIFTFCYLISKVVATCFPFQRSSGGWDMLIPSNIEEAEEIIKNNQVISQRFNELISSYIKHHHFDYAPRYLLEAPYTYLVHDLTESMELFILGHEYSHILLGHLSQSTTSATALPYAQIDEIRYRWTQEYEADGGGLALMLKVLATEQQQNLNIPNSLCGAELFFSCTEIMDEARKRFYHETEQEGTSHPPPRRRRDMLRAIMVKRFGNQSLQCSLYAEKSLNFLWNQIKDTLPLL